MPEMPKALEAVTGLTTGSDPAIVSVNVSVVHGYRTSGTR
jgi:hypothetical protein